MANALIALFGIGDRMQAVASISGPTSYTQVTAGTPPAGPTGGQIVPATVFGLKFINVVAAGFDDSGTYLVLATTGPKASTSVTLMWITAHTGAEASGAANLSTYNVKLKAIGR